MALASGASVYLGGEYPGQGDVMNGEEFTPTPWYSWQDRERYLDYAHEWREFYARVDSALPLDEDALEFEGKWEVQFDCVEMTSFDSVAEREERPGLEVAAEMDTVMIRAKVSLWDGFSHWWHWPDPPFAFDDTWWRLSVTDALRGLPIVQHDNVNDPTGVDRYLEDIVPVGSQTRARLDHFISLTGADPVDEDEVGAILTLDEAGPSIVGAYDVGQGSANALCDDTGRPLVYVDLGGGVYQNAKSYPYQPGDDPFCCAHDQPVLLSHWDSDHWVSADKFPQYTALTWIVPRQSLGPSHLKFAAKVKANGSLRVFDPPAGWTAHTGVGLLQRCTGINKNDSGFALLGPDPDELPVLLPGDCGYQHIPDTGDQRLGGLVATHHGGVLKAAARASIPGPNGPGRAITYSWGDPNSYGHPRSPTVQAHEYVGWDSAYRLDTPLAQRGHVNYITLAGQTQIPDPDAPNLCGGDVCDCRAIKAG